MTAEQHYVCELEEITSGTGVCFKAASEQVAIFRVDNHVFALGNYDPLSKANVLSRGIIGSKDDQWFVASPVYKQRFNLETGVCFDDDSVGVPTYPAHIENGKVFITLGATS